MLPVLCIFAAMGLLDPLLGSYDGNGTTSDVRVFNDRIMSHYQEPGAPNVRKLQQNVLHHLENFQHNLSLQPIATAVDLVKAILYCLRCQRE